MKIKPSVSHNRHKPSLLRQFFNFIPPGPGPGLANYGALIWKIFPDCIKA